MSGPLTVDPRQTVRWAYRFLLGREPENDAAVEAYLQPDPNPTPDALRGQIIRSDEFLAIMRGSGFAALPAAPAIGPVDGLLIPAAPADGFFTDRFGVRTRVGYLPPSYQEFSGKVGSADGAFDMPLHETEELNALLRSVAEAQGSFAVMELGAGWGPWIVLGGRLAERRGLPVLLAGVEGSSSHVAFMRTHLADNGFNPDSHHVIHAVAGAEDGIAKFPKLPDPSGDWGATAEYGGAAGGTAEMEEVPCFSLRTLLGRMPVLDFLHCDVQGAELDVLQAAIDIVDQRVRRICIGTHGRAIEGGLLDLMAGHGWRLEFEQPCRLSQAATEMVLVADGVQVWDNRGIV